MTYLMTRIRKEHPSLMFKRAALLSLFLTFSLLSASQTGIASAKDSLVNRIIEQIVLFPQEKIHIHTDKPVYIAGETIWFRAHVANAVIHTPLITQYVYAELINPLDSVVVRVKVKPTNGAFSGYINLDQALPEGDYTLCAYTENMLNPGADYLFRKSVRVEGPLSASAHMNAGFMFNRGDRITAEVIFKDIKSGKRVAPDKLSMRINKQPLSEVRTDDDTISRFVFRLPPGSDRRVLSVETARSKAFIQIPYPQSDYDVSFFPEGGNLPAGTKSAIAFKALNTEGMPEKITGHILDSTGNIYARIETVHDGMGKFFLEADEMTKYFAVCTNEQGLEKRFDLPAASPEAYSLKTETAGDTVLISILNSKEIQDRQELYLVIHTRGMVHYAKPWNDSSKHILFDKRDFPSGILQAILFDEEMNPLSERLIFCLGDDQANTEFLGDRQFYEKRQHVNAGVQITGPDGSPRTGNFSVSVTDDNDIRQDSSVNILTSLLLTSDIRGYIHNPAFYFDNANPLAKFSLDLLMMTNGWRRYNIPEVVAGILREPAFPSRPGMEISGRVRTLIMGKPVEKATVVAFSWESGFIEETQTDSDGRFAFRGIEFPDSTRFVIQALNKAGKPGVELVIDNDLFPGVEKIPFAAASDIDAGLEAEQMSSYVTKADTKYTMENGMRTIHIEGVVINAKAPEKKDYSFSYYMPAVSQPSNNIIDYGQIEEIHPSFTSEIIYQIPFVRVEDGKVLIERMKFGLNGPVYAVLILDDMIIHEYNIDDIDPYSIERIAVLKGSQTAMLGGDGAGGAIVITTRKGAEVYKDVPKYNIRSVTPMGYQRPAEFYSPRYETQDQREIGPPDMRTTIYWNPNVIITDEGMASFDFYTADAPSEYTILVEGITSDGLIIHSLNRISRRNANQ